MIKYHGKSLSRVRKYNSFKFFRQKDNNKEMRVNEFLSDMEYPYLNPKED